MVNLLQKTNLIRFKNNNVKCAKAPHPHTQKVSTNFSLKKVRYYSTFGPCSAKPSAQALPALGKEEHRLLRSTTKNSNSNLKETNLKKKDK